MTWGLGRYVNQTLRIMSARGEGACEPQPKESTVQTGLWLTFQKFSSASNQITTDSPCYSMVCPSGTGGAGGGGGGA